MKLAQKVQWAVSRFLRFLCRVLHGRSASVLLLGEQLGRVKDRLPQGDTGPSPASHTMPLTVSDWI